MHGNYGPNVLSNEADVVIAVGMRFDDRVTGNLNTYAKQAKVIHIEIDPAEIDNLAEAHRLMYRSKVGLQAARDQMAGAGQITPAVGEMLDFIGRQSSGRHGRSRDVVRQAA